MRSTNALPPKGPSLTCGECGLKSYPPVVIECVKLKGEDRGRVRCSNVAMCARRIRLNARAEQRRAAGG